MALNHNKKKFIKKSQMATKASSMNSEIEKAVLRCFVRVVKNNGLYGYYRIELGGKNVCTRLYRRNSSAKRFGDTPFNSVEDIDGIIRTLTSLNEHMDSKIREDKHERVTTTINHLLHFFLESHGVSMNKLCELGEEIYAMSCKMLFDEDYDPVVEHQKHVEEVRDNLSLSIEDSMKLFEALQRRGMLPSDITFNDFIKCKHPIGVSSSRVNDNTFDNGVMLGASYDELSNRERHEGAWIA